MYSRYTKREEKIELYKIFSENQKNAEKLCETKFVTKNKSNKQKTVDKYYSKYTIVTLNFRDLNTPCKKTEMIRMNQITPNSILSIRTHFKYKYTHRFKVNELRSTQAVQLVKRLTLNFSSESHTDCVQTAWSLLGILSLFVSHSLCPSPAHAFSLSK